VTGQPVGSGRYQTARRSQRHEEPPKATVAQDLNNVRLTEAVEGRWVQTRPAVHEVA
jgi:hypothetical protein